MTAITASAFSRIAPRGAVAAAEVFTRVWNGLRVMFAPAPRTFEQEVADVRALANALRDEDPRLSAELMCAADRYERHYVG
jgi:hypothetical protein